MDKGLELLFEYTKFHIGVYLTLAAGYITLGTSKLLPQLRPRFVWTAVIFIAIAGFAGGVVASSITQSQSANVATFLSKETGPWSIECLKAQTWIYIEHTAF